jgi:hypothetical protein
MAFSEMNILSYCFMLVVAELQLLPPFSSVIIIMCMSTPGLPDWRPTGPLPPTVGFVRLAIISFHLSKFEILEAGKLFNYVSDRALIDNCSGFPLLTFSQQLQRRARCFRM